MVDPNSGDDQSDRHLPKLARFELGGIGQYEVAAALAITYL